MNDNLGDSGRVYGQFVIPEGVVGLHFYFSRGCGMLDSTSQLALGIFRENL